jgi:uncharacterized membrane protein
MLSHEGFKIIHLFGVAMFLGNIVVTAVWKVMADRTESPQVVAFAQYLVVLTDWIFTLGGVVLILVGGYGMAGLAGYDLWGERWLILGQTFFIASGLIWVLILVPTQTTQARQARQFSFSAPIPADYLKLNRRWLVWGVLATVLPLANLYVMIVKP